MFFKNPLSQLLSPLPTDLIRNMGLGIGRANFKLLPNQNNHITTNTGWIKRESFGVTVNT